MWTKDEEQASYVIWAKNTGRGPRWKCLPPGLEPNHDDPGHKWKTEAIAEWVYFTFQHPLCGDHAWCVHTHPVYLFPASKVRQVGISTLFRTGDRSGVPHPPSK